MPEEFGIEVEQSVSEMMKRVSQVLAEEEDCCRGCWIGVNARIDDPYIYSEW